MVRGQSGSGVSVRGWCRKHGINEAGFHWWRRELVRRDAERPTFLPVRVMEDDPASTLGRIEIVLTSGRRVQVSGPVDRAMLADVLAVLEGR
jgi:transposase-like protein